MWEKYCTLWFYSSLFYNIIKKPSYILTYMGLSQVYVGENSGHEKFCHKNDNDNYC